MVEARTHRYHRHRMSSPGASFVPSSTARVRQQHQHHPSISDARCHSSALRLPLCGVQRPSLVETILRQFDGLSLSRSLSVPCVGIRAVVGMGCVSCACRQPAAAGNAVNDTRVQHLGVATARPLAQLDAGHVMSEPNAIRPPNPPRTCV